MKGSSWRMIETAPDRVTFARENVRAGLVIETDYAILPAGPQARPTSMAQTIAALPAAPPGPGLKTLRLPALPREKASGQAGGAAFWTFGLLLTALSFWVAGGHALFWR